jgi:hypothetical protein
MLAGVPYQPNIDAANEQLLYERFVKKPGEELVLISRKGWIIAIASLLLWTGALGVTTWFAVSAEIRSYTAQRALQRINELKATAESDAKAVADLRHGAESGTFETVTVRGTNTGASCVIEPTKIELLNDKSNRRVLIENGLGDTASDSADTARISVAQDESSATMQVGREAGQKVDASFEARVMNGKHSDHFFSIDSQRGFRSWKFSEGKPGDNTDLNTRDFENVEGWRH